MKNKLGKKVQLPRTQGDDIIKGDKRSFFNVGKKCMLKKIHISMEESRLCNEAVSQCG